MSMSKKDKLKRKLLSGSDFTWQELVTLLKFLGFEVMQGSGSRVKFDDGIADHMINLHRPHPGNNLKRYAIKQIIAKLRALLLIACALWLYGQLRIKTCF